MIVDNGDGTFSIKSPISFEKQEPVAWAIKCDGDFTEVGFGDDYLEEVEQTYVMEGWKYEVVQLYTEPQYRELNDELIEKVRVKIMSTAYECADNNEVEAYNAIKVMCSEVIAILKKANEK